MCQEIDEPLSHLKQIFYSLIHPYNYIICNLSLGSTYKTYIQKSQSKQNHAIRLTFSARTFGEQTDSALPLLNLLELLTVNVYHLQALKCTHLWHKNLLPNVFRDLLQYASNLHAYNTTYPSTQNLYKSRVRTNTGKQTISYMASIFWHHLPQKKKNKS